MASVVTLPFQLTAPPAEWSKPSAQGKISGKPESACPKRVPAVDSPFSSLIYLFSPRQANALPRRTCVYRRRSTTTPQQDVRAG